ncbi:DUF6538 domain-containing protein [Sphingomonas kaistensis]|uniref:DUF6538 domain-containing protein n=1 Tax=Sphingomonas kaistensis TaxID=298708 RepID=A0ABZ2G3J6_9SPHN
MARGDGYKIIKRRRKGREIGPYQVRVQVPANWRAVVGQNEVLRSLGTADRRAAGQLAPQVVTDLLSEWREKAGELGPTGLIDPADVAVRVAYDGMLKALEQRRKTWPADNAGYASRLAQREADLRRMSRQLHAGDTLQWEAVADRAIQGRGLRIEKGTDAYSAFVQAIAEASIDAVAVFTRRANGELDAEPRTQTVQTPKAKQAAMAKPGETFLELFERWSAESLAKGRKRPDTVDQDRKVIKQFVAFVGTDRAVDSIEPIEIAAYRDTMRDLPPKWMSKRELGGLDMRVAATKARKAGMPRMAFTNINKHLSTISPLYTWLRKQPRWAGLRNPVDGLFYDGVKGLRPRPPFRTDDLNKILGSPLFTGFLADGQEHLPGNMHADD